MVIEELSIMYNKWSNVIINENKATCICSCGNVEEHYITDIAYDKIRMCTECIKKDNIERQREKLEDKVFGSWHVENFLGNRKYICTCLKCNTKHVVAAPELKRGRTKKCKKCAGNNLKDLTDQIFGEYKVIRYVGNHYWECECIKCGRHNNVTSQHLTKGQCTQCKDCYSLEMRKRGEITRIQNWKDKKFGKLTPIKYIKDIDSWECQCDCGNKTIVYRCNLIAGHTKSCGCATVENKNNTMMLRYNEIASRRLDNKRTKEQIETLSNIDKFRDVVDRIYNEKGRRPTSYELADILDVKHGTICNYARKYDIDLYDGSMSNQELQFYELFNEARVHCRDIITNQEIDFYFNETKLAVEMNGVYWLSTIYKDKYYHQDKTIACAKQGIQLIHIFEYEWNDNDTRNKLIELIKRKLNKSECIHIYGRNTKVAEISNDEAIKFEDKYHLQGGINAKINIGCYYNNEIIGVMALGKPRFSEEADYEIYRQCWNTKYKVTGGIEKIFSYFVKKYKPNSIITYTDISKFTGNSYLKLGFKAYGLNSITAPNYKWVSQNLKSVLSRYQTQKHNLIKQGLGVYGSTEDDIMYNIGYYKIYDSGNIKMLWTK